VPPLDVDVVAWLAPAFDGFRNGCGVRPSISFPNIGRSRVAPITKREVKPRCHLMNLDHSYLGTVRRADKHHFYNFEFECVNIVVAHSRLDEYNDGMEYGMKGGKRP
jgi:hypothetical protein